jgi:hypothetical protein
MIYQKSVKEENDNLPSKNWEIIAFYEDYVYLKNNETGLYADVYHNSFISLLKEVTIIGGIIQHELFF